MNPEENIVTNPVVSQTAIAKIGKFKASRMIVKESWNVLKQDKEIMWFPILSGIVSLVLMAVFVIFFFVSIMNGDASSIESIKSSFDSYDQGSTDVVGYVILFAYYIITFFATNYFLAGIYTIVHGRFNGQDLGFSDGIANANRHIGKLFAWSLISATIGLVLRIISDKSELVGKIVAGLLGAVWSILTYFSLPSLIIGQRSIKESFKESALVIRKTWGEVIIINFGTGLFFALLAFAILVLLIGLVVLVPTVPVAMLAALLFVLSIILITVVATTLGSIFKLALYEYAVTGSVPQGFTPDLIKGAIAAKK